MTRPGQSHLAGTAAFFMLLATITGMAAAEVPSSEVDALLAWKASLVDPAALSSWTRNAPVCNWVGLLCNAISVVELALPGLGLSGELGTLDMQALPALWVLDLNGNNLGGDISASISRLHSLQVLDLSNNKFSGSIPPELGDLSRLFHVRLSHNNLAGDIPHQLCRLLSIKVLDLSNNRLSGELPGCWCSLQALRLIDLSQNQLTGKLPDCWWNLQSLQFMDLSNNSFSGEIPAANTSHSCSLSSLYLAQNSFTGAFPTALRGCNTLATLDIGNNRFFGDIPTWIGSQVPSLTILSLRSNNFTGAVPPELSFLPKLQLLDVSNNILTGSIPVAFGSLSSMRNPKFPNSISVWIPEESPQRSKYPDRIDIIWKGRDIVFQRGLHLLAGIDLSGNLLSQCIPKELLNLRGLRFLNLSRNHLSCSIPEDIGRLSFIEALDLSSNELSGYIPPSISSLSWLSIFNVSNNHLSGKIPAGRQIQTLTDPSIYANNSGLCGFPLDIPCANTWLAPDERNGEAEDHWIYYCVVAGIVFGFWLWFGLLFTFKTWRYAFLFIVDGIQFKIMK
jgi:Leucine-rich repeat (LRR) protein